MIRVGTEVRLVRLPEGISELPAESRRIFRFCLNRRYRVSGIDSQGLLVLDVSEEVDPRFGGYGNDLRVEAACVEAVGAGE